MLSLKTIFLEMEGDGEILEFPNDNFTLSIFRGTKKLLFSPQYHNAITNKIRTLINMLKQNFRILRINNKDLGAFEVEVDPREDFESIVDYIKNQAETTV